MTPQRTIKRGDGFVTERPQRDGGVRYQARWHDGVKWRAKTFPSLDDAEDHLRTIGRSKRAGRYTPETDMTVSELVAEYIERGRGRWSTNTVATYSLLARKQIGPSLGKGRIVDLTTARVQRWLDSLTVSPAVIENARTVLSGACKEAVQLGMLTVNPVTGSKPPARQHTTKQTWTPEQVRAVLAVVRDDPRYHALYLVALTTGVRPGELRALMWQDLDTERGILTVRRSMTRTDGFQHIIGTGTKTKRVRSIALPTATLDALAACRADQRRRRLAAAVWQDRDLIFDRGDGNPLAQQSLATHHTLVCERAKVPRIRMHDTRHTAATLMLRNNVHPKVVADILGHSSITTTLDLYSHTSVDLQRSAIDALSESFTTARENRA